MTSARRAATGPATDATNSPAKHAAEATPPPYLKQVVGGLAAIVVACLALPGASAVTGSASPLAPAASYAVPAAGLGTPSRGDVDSQLSRTRVRTPLADDRAATETTAATPDPSAAALPSESAPAATPEPAASTAAAPASPTAPVPGHLRPGDHRCADHHRGEGRVGLLPRLLLRVGRRERPHLPCDLPAPGRVRHLPVHHGVRRLAR